MTTPEQIQIQVSKFPPEKQADVLNFVSFLQERLREESNTGKLRSLQEHPAFGSWSGRNIDSLEYQRALRAEWDDRD